MKIGNLTFDQLQAAWSTFEAIKKDNEIDLNLDLGFNAWDLSAGGLCGVALALFDKLDLISYIGSTESEFLEFIADVEQGYFNNPYHSFKHAVDVCIILYYFLNDLEVARYLEKEDILTLMIAAICHDIGHPGVNNLYQVNAQTELAQAFEGVSVLENHSCRLSANMIAKHQLFRKSETQCQIPVTTLENWIVEDILSTDMSYHFDLLEELTNLLEWSSSPPQSLFSDQDPVDEPSSLSENEYSEIDFRRKLCKLLLHASDISNAVRPWPICKNWSDMVIQEFFHQGDLEKRLNLPISPNMDRSKSSQPQIALDFDEFIVKPFFEILSEFIPECNVFLDNLQANRYQWMQMKRQSPHCHFVLDLSEMANEVLDPKDSAYQSRRVSFSAGTVVIPKFFCEELRRYSTDITLRNQGGSLGGGLLRHSRRPQSLSRPSRYSRKRDGCPPDKMSVLNSLLKHSLPRMPSSEALGSSLPSTLDIQRVS